MGHRKERPFLISLADRKGFVFKFNTEDKILSRHESLLPCLNIAPISFACSNYNIFPVGNQKSCSAQLISKLIEYFLHRCILHCSSFVDTHILCHAYIDCVTVSNSVLEGCWSFISLENSPLSGLMLTFSPVSVKSSRNTDVTFHTYTEL